MRDNNIQNRKYETSFCRISVPPSEYLASGNVAGYTGLRDLIPAFMLVNIHFRGLGVISLFLTIIVISILSMCAIQTPLGQWRALLAVCGWI